MKKLLGLMGLIGLMGIIPIGPIMSMNPIQAQDTSRLELCVETRQFFQDNEWFGLHATGYTLPGFYLRPKVATTRWARRWACGNARATRPQRHTCCRG